VGGWIEARRHGNYREGPEGRETPPPPARKDRLPMTTEPNVLMAILSPLVIAVFLLWHPVAAGLRRRRDERKREVASYLGETIPRRPGDML